MKPEEIVARALCDRPDDCAHGSGWAGPNGSGMVCHVRVWETKLGAATAALRALEEHGYAIVPHRVSSPMLDAAGKHCDIGQFMHAWRAAIKVCTGGMRAQC